MTNLFLSYFGHPRISLGIFRAFSLLEAAYLDHVHAKELSLVCSAWPPSPTCKNSYCVCTYMSSCGSCRCSATLLWTNHQGHGKAAVEVGQSRKSLLVVAFHNSVFHVNPQSSSLLNTLTITSPNLKKHNQGPRVCFGFSLTNNMICKYKEEPARQGTRTM